MTSLPSSIRVGQRLTNFGSLDVTVARVASGGFGVVAMGPDQAHGGRWVALKMLRPDLFSEQRLRGGSEAEQRLQSLFLREALTWIGLWPHPNLVAAHFVVQLNGQLMLAIEYAEDGSLRDLFEAAQRQGGWPTTDSALLLAQQIAAGLLALHTSEPALMRPQPIVHRDLKPENILLKLKSGRVMITDFGLAKAVVEARLGDETKPIVTNPPAADTAVVSSRVASGQAQLYQTRAGAALGTPAYMAPEQWLDARLAQEPADLYAFGIILAELLTGRHPLIALDVPHTLEDWRQAHTYGRPTPLRMLGADLRASYGATLPSDTARARLASVWARLERLLEKLLAKESVARPSASETLAELRIAAAELGEQPYTPSDTYPGTSENTRIFWQGWATAYDRFGLHAEALPRIERALKVAPEHPHVLNAYGDILAHLGRMDEAEAVYRQELTHIPANDPQRKIGLNQLGNRLSEQGHYKEAEAAYAEALTLDHQYAGAWYNRAVNDWLWAQEEAQAGRSETARTHTEAGLAYAERALALNPTNPTFRQVAETLRQLCDSLGG